MNNKLITLPAPAVMLGIAACLLSPTAHAAGSGSSAAGSRPPGDAIVAAQDHKSGQSARDIIGRDVKSTTGADLGEVKDLVVSMDTGRIVYALVASGGVLGLGETIRAVPFAAFNHVRSDDGAVSVDLKGVDWVAAPTIREDDIQSISADNRGRTIHEFYGREVDDLPGRGKSDTNKGAGSLARVSEIIGQDVEHGNREAGDVEDVVLDLSSRRASVLLDPNDEFAGTNEKFLIKFSQLSRGATDDDALKTNLTAADFAKAAPVDANVWTDTNTYPYRWTGYAIMWNTLGDPTAQEDAARRTTSTTSPASDELSGRPAVSVVRGALRSDTELSDMARQATITAQGNKLVITGSVRSEEMKEKVTETVKKTANGWTIDNQLSVAATE